MKYWLLKTEPSVFSIDEFKKIKETLWDGVRNYQARNYLTSMEKGDLAFIYHSNADPTGIVGLGKIVENAIPEPQQFDPKSDYFDPQASKGRPRWFSPKIRFVKKYSDVITLETLKGIKGLEGMQLLRKGNRLSVLPVTEDEYGLILEVL